MPSTSLPRRLLPCRQSRSVKLIIDTIALHYVVCLSVRALKGKRLELLTPKSVEMVHGKSSSCIDHEVRKCQSQSLYGKYRMNEWMNDLAQTISFDSAVRQTHTQKKQTQTQLKVLFQNIRSIIMKNILMDWRAGYMMRRSNARSGEFCF